ncbi:Pyrroline-5-carboxylate reductase [Lachnellula suecica]|uniref:Pyrroline-5-carboxylate reductase n=1 Tax=Lachnellula suecica TaxID=602035 RepID=A0A8T9BQM8_9HELO|nr:Pyrroline-5-carboxylate reductase [Lachnellula suecica]
MASEMTMTVLGCGTMGIAILSGILSSLNDKTSKPAEDAPSHLPSRFIACVRSNSGADKIKTALSSHMNAVHIVQNDNRRACADAQVILLGCKPYMVKDILAEKGMQNALAGKLLISICGGLSKEQLHAALYASHTGHVPNPCIIVRAMPNTASAIRESMTVVATSTPPLKQEDAALVSWIFNQIGSVEYLPPTAMDASTALCGSGPAFFLLMMEAAIDGAVAMGIPRAEATRMAAQTMRGASGMVLAGEHPAVLKDKVTTPGGLTRHHEVDEALDYDPLDYGALD